MFYGENIYHESYKDGIPRKRVPYFYIHGILEDELGYDCCDATIEELSYISRSGIRLTEVVMLDGRKEKALLFTEYKYNRINGLICAISDLQAVKYCLTNYKNKSMYTDEEGFLKTEYKETYNLIFK